MSSRTIAGWWTSVALSVFAATATFECDRSVAGAQFPSARSQPVAMIVDVQGEASVVSSRGSVPARRMLMLRPKDRIERTAEARVKLIFLADLHYEVIRGAAAVVGQDKCEPAEAVERIDAPELQRQPALGKLRDLTPNASGAAGVLARMMAPARESRPSTPPVIVPSRNTGVVTDRPTFSWTAQGPDAVYRFTLVDAETGDKVVEQTTRAPKFELPADRPALKRGHVYLWDVATHTADKKPWKIEGEFFVFDADEAKQLSQLAALADSAKPEEVLLAALTFRSYECWDDALKLFERLLRLAPDDLFIRNACEEAYRQVGRVEDAERLRRAKSAGSTKAAKN